jgi:hypothetical protein
VPNTRVTLKSSDQTTFIPANIGRRGVRFPCPGRFYIALNDHDRRSYAHISTRIVVPAS